MGVTVNEKIPDIRTATLMVTPNSRKYRPVTPPMNRTGMNTAISDSVIETIVEATSLTPATVACIRGSPRSRWRTTFSITTIASSMTKPTAIVSAINDKLSTL